MYYGAYSTVNIGIITFINLGALFLIKKKKQRGHYTQF